MSTPVTVTVPHRLGREEALRRLKSGFASARGHFGALLTIEEEAWAGDRLSFQVRALGQSAAGTIEVAEDNILITVMLPWLLARAAGYLLPELRKQTTLLLEKK
jgi:hypothetical protein